MIREVMGASMDLIEPLATYMRSIVRKNHWSHAFGRNLRMILKRHAGSAMGRTENTLEENLVAFAEALDLGTEKISILHGEGHYRR
jgi:hypothetical protein